MTNFTYDAPDITFQMITILLAGILVLASVPNINVSTGVRPFICKVSTIICSIAFVISWIFHDLTWCYLGDKLPLLLLSYGLYLRIYNHDRHDSVHIKRD